LLARIYKGCHIVPFPSFSFSTPKDLGEQEVKSVSGGGFGKEITIYSTNFMLRCYFRSNFYLNSNIKEATRRARKDKKKE
jgi:hypothetical protein